MEGEPARETPLLRKLAVQRFRSLADVTVELPQLSVLFGTHGRLPLRFGMMMTKEGLHRERHRARRADQDAIEEPRERRR